MKTGNRGLMSVFTCLLVLSACTSMTPEPTATIAPSPDLKPAVTDPFVGEWVATDPLDGSNLAINITRGDDESYNIAYVDDGALVCGDDGTGKPNVGIKITFTGKAHEDILGVNSTSAICLTTPTSPLDREFSSNYYYQAATDTLTDNMDQTLWNRK